MIVLYHHNPLRTPLPQRFVHGSRRGPLSPLWRAVGNQVNKSQFWTLAFKPRQLIIDRGLCLRTRVDDILVTNFIALGR